MPRTAWGRTDRVRTPSFRSPVTASHAATTKSAQNERKNIASPAGTRSAALMNADMTVKAVTAEAIRTIPRTGRAVLLIPVA